MQKIAIDQFGTPDREGLQKFLELCQLKAIEGSHPILACISLPSEYLDPLAVLQSVNDPSEEHCYLERNSKHEGVACAESVISLDVSGEDRFRKARAFLNEWNEHTIFIGDDNLPWAGPHFFCSAAFEDEPPQQDPFFENSFHLFLPRWQVGWKGARFSATANLIVAADTPLDLLIEPVWRAHQRFSSFEHSPEEFEVKNMPLASECTILNQEASESGYLSAVHKALESIKAGEIQKVVVSRKLKIRTNGEFVPLDLLNKLRGKYPDCCSFSFQNGKGESFIGSTPERLIRVKDGVFETEALAGSIARGENARQDAYFSRQLLASEKDRLEHGLVLKFIEEALEKLGLEVEAEAVPEILQLSNIQHLRVPLKGKMKSGLHLLDLVEALHPTPALGGYPKAEAQKKISEIEDGERDRYGGLTGWLNLNGDGEFTVNIRCARVNADRATLFGGAGIVADSIPEKELRETELKLIGMLPNFMNLD